MAIVVEVSPDLVASHATLVHRDDFPPVQGCSIVCKKRAVTNLSSYPSWPLKSSLLASASSLRPIRSRTPESGWLHAWLYFSPGAGRGPPRGVAGAGQKVVYRTTLSLLVFCSPHSDPLICPTCQRTPRQNKCLTSLPRRSSPSRAKSPS